MSSTLRGQALAAALLLTSLGLVPGNAAAPEVALSVPGRVSANVSMAASGTFVVAWEDQRQLFRSDIYAQAYNAAGTASATAQATTLAAAARAATRGLGGDGDAAGMLAWRKFRFSSTRALPEYVRRQAERESSGDTWQDAATGKESGRNHRRSRDEADSMADSRPTR